ncbi:hypothetical protein GWK47_017472 [Chionoecetes opilio]|uniref:GCN5-related N-acetyltransferase Rv2170-like domain-containing protein n=1 Tax=Chionoecetes opilio TaxID=41210 RepID=A0A8J5CJ25_CHIOP|nr:hypothetical protein GWK47_017472 [Chionoecetes opilio]
MMMNGVGVFCCRLPQMYHMTRLGRKTHRRSGRIGNSTILIRWKVSGTISFTFRPSVSMSMALRTVSGRCRRRQRRYWCHGFAQPKSGGWENTFTVPHHRRQGLAGAATMALANQLLQEGLPAFVNIEESNTASVQLHEKLGLERQGVVVVVQLLPTEVTNQDYLE